MTRSRIWGGVSLRRCVLSILLISLLAFVPVQLPLAQAAPRDALVKQASRGGIVVSIGVLHRSFPRGALTTVDVTVRNVGHDVLYILPTCNHTFPDVGVRNRSGTVVYPPIVRRPLAQGGTCQARSLRAQALRPGHTRTWHPLVVLRGPHVQAVFPVRANGRRIAGEVVRASLTVTLSSPDPPTIVVSDHPNLTATVSPPARPGGVLLFADWYRCAATGVPEIRYWLLADGPVLQPPCVHPVEWHVLGGYLNHTLGCADYSSSVDHPATVTPQVVPIPEEDTSACGLLPRDG